MPVSFSNIQIGQSYDRPFLANLWGYGGHQAISRGVITPQGTNIIVLFVTKEKQGSMTQYNDFVDGDLLFWEGEEKHGSDNRILNADENDDDVHLFYRDIHHTPFIYMGKVRLLESQKQIKNPSEFIFRIGDEVESTDYFEDFQATEPELETLTATEKITVVKSRYGQGTFRKNLIKLWGSCSVTGLSKLSVLRASHIKPWKTSSNQERLNPYNGLLLTPNYDHLFDKGFISFKDDRSIILSSKLSSEEFQTLKVDDQARLRKINKKHMKFLEYHRDSVFDKMRK